MTTSPLDHTSRAHALLSASGAHRWLNCTPSPRLETQYPDTGSDAAAEGTAAHELAEHKLHALLGGNTPKPRSHWQDAEMEDHTDAYVRHIAAELAEAKKTTPHAFVTIEQRLDFSHIAPGGFGTVDTLIITDDTIHVIDFKYGKGLKVIAEHNPQMMLYALGALRLLNGFYDITHIKMTIFQPRLDNISTTIMTVDELEQWATTTAKPAATLAATGEGQQRSGDWCQFCRHAPQCPTLARAYLQPLPKKGDSMLPAAPAPETLTDTQIAEIITLAGDIKKWLTKVEAYALTQAHNGKTYPGLKIVEGRSLRKYTDEDAAAAVEAAGFNPWERKILGITAMTKQLGKKRFDEILNGLVHKPQGKPTLVPESDKRPALPVATPATVFNQLES